MAMGRIKTQRIVSTAGPPLMFIKKYVDVVFGEAPAYAAGAAVARALQSISGHGLRSVIHPCNRIQRPEILRNAGSRPCGKYDGDVFREVYAADVIPLFRKCKEVGVRAGQCDAGPHFRIFAGHKIAANMDPEKTRSVYAAEVLQQFGFHGGQVVYCKFSISIPGVAGVFVHPVCFESVTPVYHASFASLRAAGAAGRERNVSDGTELAISVTDSGFHGVIPPLSVVWCLLSVVVIVHCCAGDVNPG